MNYKQEIDAFYLDKDDPIKGCLLALRTIVLSMDQHITPEWKYKMPFFYYKGKMFCYFWIHKKYKQPYIGIVEGQHIIHPDLLTEKRSRMKIMLFDPNEDIPVDTVKAILQQALDVYQNKKN